MDAGMRDASNPPANDMDARMPEPTADAGTDGGRVPDDDRCAVAVLDPAKPPAALMVSGSLGTHDPTVIEEDGVFYTLQTGPRLPAKRSTDLRAWQDDGRALGASNPAWVGREVPEASDLWAPDLSFFGGQYHVYYSASSFGSNSSCIGHATRARMSTGSWSDQGSVVCSNHGSNDNWNAIDPNAIVDQNGNAYLVFGSFWDGIKAIELDERGARKNTALHAIASRNGGAIEAPVVVRRCGLLPVRVVRPLLSGREQHVQHPRRPFGQGARTVRRQGRQAHARRRRHSAGAGRRQLARPRAQRRAVQRRQGVQRLPRVPLRQRRLAAARRRAGLGRRRLAGIRRAIVNNREGHAPFPPRRLSRRGPTHPRGRCAFAQLLVPACVPC
jgi:hypothetical protein